MSAAPAAGFSIRDASAVDRAAVKELLVTSSLPTAGISETLDGFLVAEGESQIVGAIGLERYGDYGLLRSAAVHPSHQGHGIGRALVDKLLAKAATSGVSAVYLLTTTAESYFPGFGFARVDRSDVPQEVRESVEFADACPASATVMRVSIRD